MTLSEKTQNDSFSCSKEGQTMMDEGPVDSLLQPPAEDPLLLSLSSRPFCPHKLSIPLFLFHPQPYPVLCFLLSPQNPRSFFWCFLYSRQLKNLPLSCRFSLLLYGTYIP